MSGGCMPARYLINYGLGIYSIIYNKMPSYNLHYANPLLFLYL